MKKLLFVLPAIILFTSCLDRKQDKNGMPQPDQNGAFKDTTTVLVIDTVHDFGKVTDGERVTYSYRFVNTGKNPLIVSSAHPSCGCTVAEVPKEPIKTGDTGFIKIEFNSTGRVGIAEKNINVTSNAYSNFPDLKLKGEVMKKD